MKTIHDLDPNLFIEALELLPLREYSCHALTQALKNRGEECTYAGDGSETHVIYAGLFAPEVPKDATEWTIKRADLDLEYAPYITDSEPFDFASYQTGYETAVKEWRETALCFMASIAADPWGQNA